MNLFDLTPSAEHFCRPFKVPPAPKAKSVKALVVSLSGVTKLSEGTTDFDEYRLALLSSIERWLLYSTTHYRRALDMLTPGSAPWAHVTLYYSSFFAANAVLGMFGGFVRTEGKRIIVDVSSQTPGSQEFVITRNAPVPMSSQGSHGHFWAYFYDAAAHIAAWAPPGLAGGLAPPGSPEWQTRTRNDVNYDMLFAFETSQQFKSSFDQTTFPKCVTGNLGQQLETTEKLLQLALTFAANLKLQTFAIEGLAVGRRRPTVQRRVVRMRPPNVTKRSALATLLAL